MSLRDGCTFQTELGSATSDWVLLRNASRCGQSTSKGNYDQPKTQKFHVKLCWIEDGPSRPRQALFNFGHVGAYRLLVSPRFCTKINWFLVVMFVQKATLYCAGSRMARANQDKLCLTSGTAYFLLESPKFYININVANWPWKAIMINNTKISCHILLDQGWPEQIETKFV